MLFIGYFEGLDSQRGIAWRCADSLGLRSFLGVALTEATPVHASMTIIRQRLPESVFDKVFVFVLGLLEQKGLLRGKAVAIDATTLEANAAMRSIVRKDTGEDWKQYLRGLAQAEGIDQPDGRRSCVGWIADARTRKSPTSTGKAPAIPTVGLPR